MGVQLPSEPITRKEQYLAKAAGQAVEIPVEPITREEAYLDAIAKGGGGGGGTTNYNQLSNKPQIAGTTLQGNKTLSDLGIASASALGDVSNAVTAITDGQTINSFADVETALSGKQNTITAGDDLKFSGSTLNVEVSVPYIDEYDLSTDGNGNVVVQKFHGGEYVISYTCYTGSYNSVNVDDKFTVTCTMDTPYYSVVLTEASTDAPAGTTYGWEYAQTPAVSNIQFELAETGTASEFIADLNEALANKQDTLTFDNVPTENSNNPVKSGGVKSAIDAAVSRCYHHAGTKTCVELVAGLLVAANEGNVYNMTDSGTTTADFIEGAGQPIKAGDNVGIAKISDGVYKFDLLSGFVDTSNFVQKSVTEGLIKNDGTIDTVAKQPATDNNLTTTDKTTTGAINELKSGLNNVVRALTDLDVFRIQASSGAGVIQFSEINASATTAGRLPFIILINNQSNVPTLVMGNAYAHQSTGIKDMRFSSADVTYNTDTMTMTIDAGNNAYSTSLLIAPRGLFKVAT